MSSDNKLIDISAKIPFNSQSKSDGQLSVTTEKALSIYLEELNTRLKDMVGNADDHLFDKSGKSGDGRHFVAMRTLRVKKEALYNLFKQEIVHQFSLTIGKLDNSEFFSTANVKKLPLDNLSLVEDDDLEERIAVDSMISKAQRENKIALEHLRSRLDVLLPNKVISEKENPFEPAFVCNAFSLALKPIDLDVEFQLVLYKYFERNIIKDLDLIYQKINLYFIEQAILPDLQYEYINRQPSSASRAKNRSDEKSEQDKKIEQDNSEILSVLSELLAERRGYSGAQVPQQVDTSQLVSLLSKIQATLSNFDDQSKLADVRAQLTEQLPEEVAGQVVKGALGQFNDDMIDVVTMLFDFILDDENLQPEIKAVIARLQIPILKVGLVDKSFFSNRKHSARLLLNELAHAGVSWDPADPSSAPMLKTIKTIVEKICSEFSDDVQLFDYLLQNFNEFKQEHSKRSLIFERRTREAEEGKARSETAKGRVNQVLQKICYKKHVPEVVQKILKNVWVNVMFLEGLKNDDEASWKKVCKLAQLLVWSVQPVNKKARLDKLTQTVPVLIKNLKLGFSKISFSQIESSGLLDQLEDTHREIIKTAREIIEEANRDTIIRLKPVDHFSGDIAEINETDAPMVEEVITEISIEEIAFSPQEIGVEITHSQLESDELKSSSLQAIENLNAGSWFELKVAGEFKRCKLAARIASIGKFIFVNRSGVKVAEYLTNVLAAEYQLGHLKILDDDELFDRALESVISNLRSLKTAG